MKMDRQRLSNLACLGTGAIAFAFIGWRWNMALAPLFALPLLMHYTRGCANGICVVLAWPLLAIGAGLAMWRTWDLDIWLFFVIPPLRALFVLIPLALDRLARRRLRPLASTLVFPASMVAIDLALSLSPFSTVPASAVGLFGNRELSQITSIAGIWGLGFLVYWLAPAFNSLAESHFDFKRAGTATILPFAAFGAALAFGAVRIATDPIGVSSVRVAGVGVDHPRDYWNLIDEGTPRDKVLALTPELAAIEDELFARSSRAVTAGARIVTWSEGACVLTEKGEPAFMVRAQNFARESGVYLAAAVLTLHDGSGISDNKLLMFTPEGRLGFTYVKTISWYPTGSDGRLKVIDTPYGRLGAAICFDMDTPAFAHGLARLGADLVVVPAYDSEGIRPFHTEVGLYRSIENGYSVFRQVADGTSMAVDGRGVVRAMEDWFTGSDHLMIADLPTRRELTLYAATGDLAAWLDVALLAALLVSFIAASRRARRSRSS